MRRISSQRKLQTENKSPHESNRWTVTFVCLGFDSMTHSQSHTHRGEGGLCFVVTFSCKKLGKIAGQSWPFTPNEHARNCVWSLYYRAGGAAFNLNLFCQKEWTGEHAFHYHECTFPFDRHINVQHYPEQRSAYFTCSISYMPLAVELLPGGVLCNSEELSFLKMWQHNGKVHRVLVPRQCCACRKSSRKRCCCLPETDDP